MSAYVMRERRGPRLRPIPRLLVVCEGEQSEPIYLEGMRQDGQIPKRLLQIRGGGLAPMSVVDLAIQLKQENEAECPNSAEGRFDQVWCVFDRDSHRNIPEAKQKAFANGCRIAFTNPCFELFLLIHFVDCNQDLHRRKVQSALKRHLKGYDKKYDFDSVKTKYAAARTRAVTLNMRSEVEKGVERAPFCSFIDLVDVILSGRTTAGL